MRKHYDLPESIVDKIAEIKNICGFKSEVDTIIHIVNSYVSNAVLKEDVRLIMEDVFRKDFIRFRLGIRSAEQNSIIIKDILNSMLYMQEDIEYFPAYKQKEHFVIKEAQNRLKKIIEKENVKKHDLKEK